MFAAISTKSALSQHIKLILVTALLALSFLVGTAATRTHVGAEKPRAGQVVSQAPKEKLQTVYVQLDADQWYSLTGEHTDAGGFYRFKV